MTVKLVVCGNRATAAEFEKVPVNRLEVGQMYMCRIPSYDDEGNETITSDTCWILGSGTKSLNGTTKKVVKFTCTSEVQCYLSQLPMCDFFGPLKFEWMGE